MEQLRELLRVLLPDIRVLVANQFFQILLTDDRHLNDQEPRGECLIDLTGSGVPVVHGPDKPRSLIQADAVVSRNIDDPAEIQNGVKNSQRFIFRHIDLIKNAETALLCHPQNRSLPQANRAVLKRIRSDQRSGVCIDIKRNIPLRSPENRGQILRQNVFSGSLRTGQEQMLADQQRGQCLFPHIRSVVMVHRIRYPPFHSRIQLIVRTKGFDLRKYPVRNPLLFQKTDHFRITHLIDAPSFFLFQLTLHAQLTRYMKIHSRRVNTTA